MLFAIFCIQVIIVVPLLVGISLRLNRQEIERGTAELTDEDRNLLRRHARLLEENTAAQKRGRPG